MLSDHRFRRAFTQSCRRRVAALCLAHGLANTVAAACLVPCLLLPLTSGTAHAQSDGETEVARQRFREGVAHYDRQDYEKARLAFLQAYLLRPHPAVLLNLAQSELRAGRHAEAAENFAKYIRQNPTAPAMDHAKAGFDEARQRVTELNVQVNATGASISIDGADVGRSPLPSELYLMPGRHSVVARKGTSSAEKVLDATAGRREYITLELREGYTPTPLVTQNGSVSAGTMPLSSAGPVGAESDTQGGQGFFEWLGSSPAAVATISVAGLALGTSAVLAGFANNRYAAANDARSQIMSALQSDVDDGHIGSDAVPCGSTGIANGMAEFLDLSATEQASRIDQYANACDLFTDRSDSGDRLKTLSLVSLGVGAFATIGTIVWYFSDSGSSSGSTAKKGSGDSGRASLTPLLTPDTQGLMLDVSF
jgi:tetratricopeptide (TPR) repeat protein